MDDSRSADSDPPVFRLLGAVELVGETGDVRALPGRQQTVLAALLIRVNRVVGIDQLVDAIWEREPPSTARTQVQFCIHALRQEFGRLGVPAKIVTQAPGYRIDVAEQHLDSYRFEQTVATARAQAQDSGAPCAVATLRQALGLWRGPLLDGASPALREQAAWLEELRIEVLEECIALELDLGRHRDLVGELRTLVVEHPMRDQFRYQLMLALYRAGRPWDALEVYRAGRVFMVEELGLDPSEKLQQLEAAILAEDKSLLLVEDTPVRAGPAAAAPRPRQLPADIPDLTGQDEVVGRLLGLLAGQPAAEGGRNTVSIVNITGKAGVGKSALAVHLAHRLAETSFADGQLYISLAATEAQPVSAHEALGQFLRTLGVGGSSLPDTEADRAATYRNLLADRRMLVVLEDPVSEAQVVPLLPGVPSCAVLVTSRARLTGLPGAHLVHVDVLNNEQARALLSRLIGQQRVDREPAEANALVEAVGGLPLALRIVGARLAARPHWSLRSMAQRLADETRRLDELAHGEMGVRGTLLLTYNSLDPQSATLLRRLGVLNAETLPSWLALAVLDDDGWHVFDLADRLLDTQLLDIVMSETVSTPRYRFHDLIRTFARERLRTEEDATVAEEVLRRVLGGWLALAERAHCQLYGGDFTALHGDAPRWPVPAEYVDEVVADPLTWYERERVNIGSALAQAADAGLDELCWDLAVTLVSVFEVRSYFDDWEHTHQNALRATRKAGNTRGTAALQCSLGSLYFSQNRLAQARQVLLPALAAFTELGDVHGLALVRKNLGLLDRKAGETARAMDNHQLALDGFAEAGDLVGQAAVLGQMAQLELDSGEYHRTLELLEQAVAACETIKSPRIMSQMQYKRAQVHLDLGDYESAYRISYDVLDLVRSCGDLQGESYALQLMGVVQTHRGNLAEAAELLDRSIVLCERNHDRVSAAKSLLDLARVDGLRGAVELARMRVERSLVTFTEYGLHRWVEKAVEMLQKNQVVESSAR